MEACNWYGDVSLINVFIMTFLKRKARWWTAKFTNFRIMVSNKALGNNSCNIPNTQINFQGLFIYLWWDFKQLVVLIKTYIIDAWLDPKNTYGLIIIMKVKLEISYFHSSISLEFLKLTDIVKLTSSKKSKKSLLVKGLQYH